MLALLAACCLASAAGGRAATPASCGTASFRGQNGNQLFVPGTGPRCLYQSFARCRATSLSLQGHGVDAMLQLTFRIVRRGSVCGVSLAGSNTVFFGSRTRKTTWSDMCAGATERPEGIVIRGCPNGDYLLSPLGAPAVASSTF